MQKLIRHKIARLSCYFLVFSISLSPVVNASLMSSMANMKAVHHDSDMDNPPGNAIHNRMYKSCDQHPGSKHMTQKHMTQENSHAQGLDTDSYNCQMSDACALHCSGAIDPLPPVLNGLFHLNKSIDWRTPIIQVPAFLSSFTLDRPPRS